MASHPVNFKLSEGRKQWQCARCKGFFPDSEFCGDRKTCCYCRTCRKVTSKKYRALNKGGITYIADSPYLVLLERMRDRAAKTKRTFREVMNEALTAYLTPVVPTPSSAIKSAEAAP